MRSTYFTDKASIDEDIFFVEEQDEKPYARGFVVLTMVMVVLYVIAPRPVLYAALKAWSLQLVRGVFG